jgi:cation:H+ antiporter
MFRGLPLSINIAVFIGSAMVVWFAGARLAGYADAIAEKTGVGREFVGILLLGGVTSLPELAVATTATLQGTPLLSVNDVLGSAAINLVILGIADATIRRGALTALQPSPVVLLQAVLGIMLMALAMGAVVAGDVVILGIGVWCWLMLAVYLLAIWLLARSRAADAWQVISRQSGETAVAAVKAVADSRDGLGRLVRQTVAAGASILVAGFLLARTGDAMAEQTGLGSSFFGAVFLGLSTSLPEISTVIAAVRLSRYELALSDIFGTNLFNVTIIVLVDALYPGGSVLVEAGRFAGFSALLALFLTTLFLVGLIERQNRTVWRMGIDSVAAFTVYGAGVAVLYTLK